MHNCIKCNNEIPDTQMINGKKRYLHRREFCLDCSPFGSRKFCGKSAINRLEFDASNGFVFCPDCKKEHKITQKNKNYVCSKCRSRKIRDKNKSIILDLCGGKKCKRCGYNKYVGSLHFHHIDPKEKEFTVSSRIHWSLGDAKKEAKKCIVLCGNCHAELHGKIWDINELTNGRLEKE